MHALLPSEHVWVSVTAGSHPAAVVAYLGARSHRPHAASVSRDTFPPFSERSLTSSKAARLSLCLPAALLGSAVSPERPGCLLLEEWNVELELIVASGFLGFSCS